MSVPTAIAPRPTQERVLEALRRAGNPFRNYFARNADDDVCARYHVPELFALERDQLLGVVDLYRNDPAMHSEVVPILGNKGAGKTHLLHSIKHGGDGGWQVVVTPGVYQKDSDFLEYLLFQVIDTLLGGGKQKGVRPLDFVGEALVRDLLAETLEEMTSEQQLELFPAPGLGRWMRKLGLGTGQAEERTRWLLDSLGRTAGPSAARLCEEAGVDPERACELVCGHVDHSESYDTAGLMRLNVYQGFARAVLTGDEADLANFLTFGFAELEFQIRPSRQELVLALCKVLMAILLDLKIPVVVAFDQLEDLLLARRTQDGHRVAETFFAGIVHAMHQIDGLCFLVFAERGLWNRFVPSLDGYIRDRLNNPVHVPTHGTIKALRLEPPLPDLVRQVVEARLHSSLEGLPEAAELPGIFPFTPEQVTRIARSEPTLRDMLQQFRQLFDHLVYGAVPAGVVDATDLPRPTPTVHDRTAEAPAPIKSYVVVETPAEVSEEGAEPPVAAAPRTTPGLAELWEKEVQAARGQLEPAGALTGATRELQAGLGTFLRTCHEHGVKVGPWRLSHVVAEFSFGEHPTYGMVSVAHWACKDGQPWKVGVGLFLGRGGGKPKDLETKLSSLEAEPSIMDHLVLLRHEEDLTLSGKSKSLWQESERRGRHARLEGLSLNSFAVLYGFPRWLAAVTEALSEGRPLPNLADFIQERCERLLEQVCMPIQQ